MIEPNSAAVTMWLALDDADEQNGCLVYVKGSGHKAMRPHQVHPSECIHPILP